MQRVERHRPLAGQHNLDTFHLHRGNQTEIDVLARHVGGIALIGDVAGERDAPGDRDRWAM